MHPLIQFNLILAWVWILLGFVSGAILGCNFHREDWLGGYASHRRRMYRLGHISFFGLAIMNFLFVQTLEILSLNSSSLSAGLCVASLGFAVGALTMPACCALAAHRTSVRSWFAVPVSSLILGAGWTLWEVMHL